MRNSNGFEFAIFPIFLEKTPCSGVFEGVLGSSNLSGQQIHAKRNEGFLEGSPKASPKTVERASKRPRFPIDFRGFFEVFSAQSEALD